MSGRSGNLKVTGSNLDLAFSNPGQVKPMTFKLILLASYPGARHGKDWLAQCQDSAIEWDSRSWFWQSGVPVRQRYIIAMSAHCHKTVPVRPPGTASYLTGPLMSISDAVIVAVL